MSIIELESEVRAARIILFCCKKGISDGGYTCRWSASLQREEERNGLCKVKREREKYGFGSRCVMHFRCWVKKEHHSNKHLFVAALADRNFTCMRLAFAQILSEKRRLRPSLTPTLSDFGRKIKNMCVEYYYNTVVIGQEGYRDRKMCL